MMLEQHLTWPAGRMASRLIEQTKWQSYDAFRRDRAIGLGRPFKLT